ncbi:MAG TPA: AMP-binding protein [Polyangiaceae bacterium]|nr:AMP-binding protein [Polyangiaceae bacterium]
MSHENGMNGANGASHVNGAALANGAEHALDLEALLEGKRLVVVGGTGYLGKTWWSFLLAHWPKVGHLYLIVREKRGQSAEERFWKEIVPTAVFDPLRAAYGAHFEQFLREKVTPVAGDVVRPFCGLGVELRNDLRGTIDAVVNAAGVVDFDPPLDEALEVNAFGVQNLVALAKDLGEKPLLHTSTCYVAGSRTGHIHESSPLDFPFPRADELERGHWDPDREIAECLDVIEQARHRASDAFRQSRFLDEAKKTLAERGEPGRGRVLDAEVIRVKRKFVEARLAEMGMERAQFWGFPNTYTYTKAIGEQIVARSGLAFTIVRPAIVESALRYPSVGWNEGINTSAPLIYILREGGLQIPGSDHFLDIIPVDMVAGGMCVALGELLEGRQKLVYQLGSTDTNPCTMRRFFELTGLYKRKYYQRTVRGGPLFAYLQSHFEGALLNRPQFESYGPRKLASRATSLAGALDKAAVGPARALLSPAADAMRKFARQQQRVGKVLEVFVPFTVDYHYVFRCDHVREGRDRLSVADRRRVGWEPESIDWRAWFFDVHMPGLEKWVFPQIDEKVKRRRRAPERHETLTALLDDMAARFDLAVALQRAEPDGLTRLSFREWREHALSAAARLGELGVKPGDRVALAAQNHPAWPIVFFGVLYAGATVVPLDAGVELDVARTLVDASGARVFLCDRESRERLELGLSDRATFVDIRKLAAPGTQAAPPATDPNDVAALIYTSGTTGKPKGVALSHQNLTALVASLAPLFPLDKADRVLSVLPLHHTFELTCGMLLPLSRGSRIVYLDELNAERLEHALSAGRITGLIGVPALWEMLERRILSRVAERGALFSHVFDFAVELNRSLGKAIGMDAGRALFGPVHQGLGGHLRFLVSGGAALPERTHHLFAGLGLHLAEGYGLTEASPVLTVAEAGPTARSGHVGKPIPGVELKILEPNADGIGEVVARGPNVMLGYSDDPEATRQSIDEDGWLRTGDLGKLDGRGNLVISGRKKDVIVASNGENVYPDDVEARLGRIEGVKELAVIGLPDGRGGERVACVAVPEQEGEGSRAERHARARRALDTAVAALPVVQRPVVITLLDTPLPRTTTRKVKRAELRRQVERLLQASEPPSVRSGAHDVAAQSVRSAAATIARRDAQSLHPAMSLRGDLAFDSLMLLELLVALEAQHGRSFDAERLNACQTLGDVEALLRERAETRRPVASATIVEATPRNLEVPEPLRDAAMHWLGRAQHGFYDRVLETAVLGRAHIPYNRNVIVAANHASHLDMGLVKYALGSYGDELVSLAAQDYFFEGNRFLTAYFENFTRLVPMPRNGTLRQGLRKAGELLDQGKTVLLFPEGTRSTDGQVHEFKAIVGHLALHHGVDVLPIYLGGTHAALPKGGKVVRRRDVEARIGPVLEAAELRRLTTGLPLAEASRKASRLIEEAVRSLGRGSRLVLASLTPEAAAEEPPPAPTLGAIFQELERRFAPSAVERPTSYYFSLGDDRFTLLVSKEGCEVKEGKHVAAADCVLKTSPDLFTRIVREAYVPSPAEFMSGAVKTNNVGLLLEFQKTFRLLEPASPGEGE